MKDKNSLPKKRWSPLKVGWGITILFFLLLLFLALTPYCETINSEQLCQKRFSKFLKSPPNEIGDTLAGIAGTLAFLWIIVTVMIQSQELKVQSKELSFQKEELKLNRIESEKTAAALSDQVFDNSFFAMLTTFNGIIADIDVGRDYEKKGRDAFGEFYNTLSYISSSDETRIYRVENTVDLIEPLEDYFKNRSKELSHYFRFLFRILTTLKQKDRVNSYHSKLLRAQLSDYELIIIYYNCLTENGTEFIPLAEKFSLFDNMPTEKLFNIEHCAALKQEVFGSNKGYWKWREGLKS